MTDYFSVEAWLIGIAGACLALLPLVSKPVLPATTNYITPPSEIQYITAGFKEQAADSFWMRAIQDTHYCEKQVATGVCVGKSWFFNLIQLVTDLAPEFSESYYYGGLSLTIFIGDQKGASVIFDKAVARFKYDWPLLYLAGYHALFEEKNRLKAAQLYLKAADNGAPDWVRLSAGKLASSGNDLELARKVLEQLISQQSDPAWVAGLRRKIQEIESQQQK
ncbi:MAG: hypothetical protein K2P92_02390 [Bdellovibrionaceae bacterium]|nr:hypothetical protein [Pseudobdellovibrionaceae bacterium]